MKSSCIVLLFVTALGISDGWAQVDPQSAVDALLRDAARRNAIRQQNELMRLELERLELEAQLRYRRMSDKDVWAELDRHCPGGQQPCVQQPPQSLLQEAARRGLIQFTGAAGPRTECSGIADPGGAVSFECYGR